MVIAAKCVYTYCKLIIFFLGIVYFMLHIEIGVLRKLKTILNTVIHTLALGILSSLLVHVASDLLMEYFLNRNAELAENVNEIIFDAVKLFIKESRLFVF